jgi:PAS domain-containing protein
MANGGPKDWDFTLLPFTRVILSLLDAVGPDAILEVGSDKGDFTAELLDWAARSGGAVTAIDPEPRAELVELADRHPDLRLIREASPEALDQALPAGVIILDGDHNYYTLSRELRAISDASPEAMPLLLIHDIGWPHARRDTYYSPERIPAEHRQPLAEDALVVPGNPGTTSEGMRFQWAAEREGGPRNGILTAVEDFLPARAGLRLSVIPAFFGLGVLWPEDAPWSAAVAEIVEPWEANPLLERLEEVRIDQVINRTRMNRQEELLRNMLNSRAFTIAEGIAGLKGRGHPPFSRERVRRALGD